MGVGYSVPKESSLTKFLAISLESPNILGIIEPQRERPTADAKIKEERKDGSKTVPLAEGDEKKLPKESGVAGPSAGLVHRMVRKQWQAGVERILRRGPQLMVHLGGNPFSSSPSLGYPTSSELAELRDFLGRLIGFLLETCEYQIEASPYTGKMFVRNTLILSWRNKEDGEGGGGGGGGGGGEGQEEENNNKFHYREYALDPSEYIIWVGIRSKNVLQLSQSALGQCAHCCPPTMVTADSEDDSSSAALLRWIRAEFSGAKIVHCPYGGGNVDGGPGGSAVDLTCPGPGHSRCCRFTEVYLQGQPFAAQKFDELITTRRLFLGLFRHFYSRGFSFCAQLSARGNGKNDTILFRKVDPPLLAANPTVYLAKQRQLFLLSFESKCHLRLFECPPEAAKAIEQSISEHHRIRQIRPSWMGCSEIVFGSPLFWADQNQLLETQLAILDMFNSLWLIGWKFSGSAQIGQSNHDKTSIVFETMESPMAPQRLFGLSTARVDQIRLLDAPPSLRTAIRTMIEAEWEKGIQQEEVPISVSSPFSERIFVFKLRGRPWSCRDNSFEAASGLHLLMFICERLNKMGWSPLCTLDVGSKVNDDDDAHLYSEDGEMFIFHMAKGEEDKDEKTMKNGLVGVEGGGGNNKGTEEGGGGEERQKKAAKKMPKFDRGESAKKDDEEEDGTRVTAAAGRRMSTV